MKTADLVDDHDQDLSFCNLPFLKFGKKAFFAGPIQTVKCFEDNVLLRAELQKPGEGRVLVVDGGASNRVAVIGDKIAALLIENNWSGVVINGSIRDSVAIDAMEVGVRCLSVSPKKSGKDGVGKVAIPVQFGGVWFKPGDWLYCDADGVLVSEKKLI